MFFGSHRHFGLFFGGGRRLHKEPKKPKPENFYASIPLPQVKDFCKACKLNVNGNKSELVGRLMEIPLVASLGRVNLSELKQACKDRLLIVSGNKADLLMRILYHEYGTGTAKRAATETIVDEDGNTKEVLKATTGPARKRAKIVMKPAKAYDKITKAIQSIRQAKWQSYHGQKCHAPMVYETMRSLMHQHCLPMIETDPLAAVDVAVSVFEAMRDHWRTMADRGYGSEEFEEACSMLQKILRASKAHLSPTKVAEIVDVLVSLNDRVSGIGLADGGGGEDNAIEGAIQAIQPDFSFESESQD
jgi:hypothetical protein